MQACRREITTMIKISKYTTPVNVQVAISSKKQ